MFFTTCGPMKSVTARENFCHSCTAIRNFAESGEGVPASAIPRPDKSDGPTAGTEATRRWAALLQQIFEVDPLACPTCRGTMRIVACITRASVIDRILAHLRTRRRRPLSTAPSPRHHAGTFGVGGRPTGASDRSPSASPHWNRRAHGPRGARSSGAGTPPPGCRRSRGRQSRRILDRPQSNFLSSIVRLLNDRFGVQARGGGSCAGTYGHYLLHVDPTRSKAITDRIDQGDLSEKPGCVQLSFHPTTTTAELTYALDAVEQIATHGARWAEDYLYDPHTNEFMHRTWDAGCWGVVQE